MVNLLILNKQHFNFVNKKAVSMLGVKSHSLWEVVETGRAWRTSDVLFISWSGCWKHGCVRSAEILPDLHYIMTYALFCVCYISEVYLPLSKSSLFLSLINKCWINMCRIIVWRAARLQHASRSIDDLVWPGHQMCIFTWWSSFLCCFMT